MKKITGQNIQTFGQELKNLSCLTSKRTRSKPQDKIISSASRKEHIESLTSNLRAHIENFSTAHEDILDAIKEFANKIEDQVIAVVKEKTQKPNHTIFGRTPVMSIFCDALEPALLKAYPEPSLGYKLLNKANLWPFRDALTLSDEDLPQKAKNLKKQINFCSDACEMEMEFNPSNERYNDLYKTGETLQLLSATISSIASIIPVPHTLHWCHFCFRRAGPNSHFCKLHHPNFNNSNHKRGKRIFEEFDADTIYMLKKFRGKRQHLHGIGELMSSIQFSNVLAEDIYLLENVIVINDPYQELITRILDSNWHSTLDWLPKFLEETFPLVDQTIKKNKFQDAENWDTFVSNIYTALQEEVETLTHPYWFFDFLKQAESWLNYERTFSDTRRTGKQKQIFDLHDQGKTIKEIAEIVDVSKQYVSKVLKGH